ncbi:MAG: hypothetical protein ONB48_00995 [candidate division KSB1 bacterium]|nr:hypothetical protein [candidate division KSB1 bacterium]MDZ7272745.1 hypothetical protein [candidate division KSB1 bacterium]MDZ7284230.1 hypothetical protein [candidate division KSB1 bacterium]MDZ7297371.1 hypothetical protein [candidate division KSB1 bacterium]MDZ7309055.1 hypothetical protein [candidate division KSB1 bacterium]
MADDRQKTIRRHFILLALAVVAVLTLLALLFPAAGGAPACQAVRIMPQP